MTIRLHPSARNGPICAARTRLTSETTLALARSATSLDELLADCAMTVADAIIAANGGPSFEAAGFEAMVATARLELPARVALLATTVADVLTVAGQVARQVALLEAQATAAGLEAALADVRRQVRGLLRRGFVTAAGEERLADLVRYLEGARRRLERLPGDLRRDGERQRVVERVQARYDQLLDGGAPERTLAAPEVLGELRWMIEELRVSLWAQSLGTRSPVSEERILRRIEHLGG
jgi:ATP-dependent helicase HrpA